MIRMEGRSSLIISFFILVIILGGCTQQHYLLSEHEAASELARYYHISESDIQIVEVSKPAKDGFTVRYKINNHSEISATNDGFMIAQISSDKSKISIVRFGNEP